MSEPVTHRTHDDADAPYVKCWNCEAPLKDVPRNDPYRCPSCKKEFALRRDVMEVLPENYGSRKFVPDLAGVYSVPLPEDRQGSLGSPVMEVLLDAIARQAIDRGALMGFKARCAYALGFHDKGIVDLGAFLVWARERPRRQSERFVAVDGERATTETQELAARHPRSLVVCPGCKSTDPAVRLWVPGAPMGRVRCKHPFHQMPRTRDG